MTTLSEQDVIKALRQVVDPAQGKDVVTLHKVGGVQITTQEGKTHVRFVLEVDPALGPALENLRQQAEKAVAAIPQVDETTVILTAHRKAPDPSPGTARPERRVPVRGVRHVIAVASGKGGVGKSTTAVNLALALAATGSRTGLLDADIYGPSIPRLMGIKDKPEQDKDKNIIPVRRHGLAVMSIGFMLAEDAPLIWRGPMVQSALQQLLRDVAWDSHGDLDVLVVDMPPGTGDAQLTLAQQVPLSGAVIVSTPQDIALIDARKGLAMFRKVDVPVLGMIENMSFFLCPHCGERSEIFGHGGAHAEADRLGCDFLGEIPLDLTLRLTSDAGTPVVANDPSSPLTGIYRRIAENVRGKLTFATT